MFMYCKTVYAISKLHTLSVSARKSSQRFRVVKRSCRRKVQSVLSVVYLVPVPHRLVVALERTSEPQQQHIVDLHRHPNHRMDDTTSTPPASDSSTARKQPTPAQEGTSINDTGASSESFKKAKASPQSASTKTAAADTLKIIKKPEFKLATFNVWFGADGRGQPYPDQRMKAVVELLKSESNADCPLLVCGLQEVIPELSKTLQPLLEEAGYKFMRQPGTQYGCALAVHGCLEILEQDWRQYQVTEMNRGFLYVRVRLPGSDDEILFANTHLESPIDRHHTTNTNERVQQIRELETFCNEQLETCKHLQMVVIAGDLNWDEGVRDVPLLTRGLQTPWLDSWLETSTTGNDDDDGYSYDCTNNPLLDGDRRVRLDRILTRGSNVYLPKDTHLIGQDPLPNLTIPKEEYCEQSGGLSTPVKICRNVPIVPSDHYGVVARFIATAPAVNAASS